MPLPRREELAGQALSRPVYRSFWKAKKPPPKGKLVTDKADAASYALSAKAFPKFKQAFTVSLDEVATPALLKQLAEAMRDKSLASVEAALPEYDPSSPESATRWHGAVQAFEKNYQALLKDSAKAELGRLDLDTSFSLDNPYSVPWIEKKAGAMVKAISANTRENLQALLKESFITDTLPPNALKQRIKGIIGLTAKQAGAVSRIHANALKEKVPPKQANEIAVKAAARLRAQRAEAIARTETIAAEAQGQLDAWRVAEDTGLILPGTKREWVASSMEKGACKWCAGLDGVQVAFDQPFKTHYGDILAPPAHVNCRCTVVLVGVGEPDNAPAKPPKPKPPKPKPLEAEPTSITQVDPEDTYTPSPSGDEEGGYIPEPKAPISDDPPQLHLRRPLAEEEKHGLYDYQGAGYRPVNTALREGEGSAEIKRQVQDIRNAIDSSVLQKPTKLYRGFTASPERYAQLVPGATYSDSGFMSTTRSRTVASQFADATYKPGRQSVVLELQMPAGARALEMRGALKGFQHERRTLIVEAEYLLEDNRNFKILSVTKQGTITHVVMELL